MSMQNKLEYKLEITGHRIKHETFRLPSEQDQLKFFAEKHHVVEVLNYKSQYDIDHNSLSVIVFYIDTGESFTKGGVVSGGSAGDVKAHVDFDEVPYFMKPSSVYNEIQDERKRQDEKWGEQNHEPPDWLMILGEEVGEVNKAALETHFGDIKDWSEYRKELIQVAAVAVSMIESLDRNENAPSNKSF